MPVLKKSNYTKSPWYLFNAHLETIIPSVFYRVKDFGYQRERLELDDGDFLDLDWVKNDSKKLIVLSHGLEGSSDRHYIMRPAKFFSERGYDVLAWNCRGCSGELNRLRKTYHHGDVEDIGTVVEHGLSMDYDEVVLIGYSMGGNMTLKYLGTKGESVDSRIKSAIGFSVPCHLEDSSNTVATGTSRMYEKRFLRKLRAKIEQKVTQFPDLAYDWDRIDDFHDFNEAFTLPVYGFESEKAFFEQARSDVYFEKIKVPTLVVNALNDPMLGEKNYPFEEAEASEMVSLETPEVGGHVGFTLPGDEFGWMEYRAERWIEESN